MVAVEAAEARQAGLQSNGDEERDTIRNPTTNASEGAEGEVGGCTKGRRSNQWIGGQNRPNECLRVGKDLAQVAADQT